VIKVLDLFSGIGGFSLGLERAGMETVAFCEYDDKCRQVLTKHWPEVPQYNDVRTLTAEQLHNDGIDNIGLICGGYPCQPFSVAGKRDGEKDDRHLWPEIKRLLTEFIERGEPIAVCLFENVVGHVSMGLDSVLADLESLGYSCQPIVVPACAVGAYHRRDRVWIIGILDTHSERLPSAQQESKHKRPQEPDGSGENGLLAGSENVADTEELQRDGGGEYRKQDKRQIPKPGKRSGEKDVAYTDSQRGRSWAPRREDASDVGQSSGYTGHDRSRVGQWIPEPAVGRVANGVPNRAHRLKQLGNAVVPQVVEVIGLAIIGAAL
jgi:DNA (cytosine-5)-methyltransferase 1